MSRYVIQIFTFSHYFFENILLKILKYNLIQFVCLFSKEPLNRKMLLRINYLELKVKETLMTF